MEKDKNIFLWRNKHIHFSLFLSSPLPFVFSLLFQSAALYSYLSYQEALIKFIHYILWNVNTNAWIPWNAATGLFSFNCCAFCIQYSSPDNKRFSCVRSASHVRQDDQKNHRESHTDPITFLFFFSFLHPSQGVILCLQHGLIPADANTNMIPSVASCGGGTWLFHHCSPSECESMVMNINSTAT